MEIGIIWESLKKTIDDMESGAMDWQTGSLTARAAIIMLLDYTPEEVVLQVKQSGMPLKATINWIVYEASKIRDMDAERLAAFKNYWDAVHLPEHGGLHAPVSA